MGAPARDHGPGPQAEAVNRRAGVSPDVAPVQPMAPATALQAVLMRTADAGTRSRMIGGLQGRIGNAGVTEILSGPPRTRRAIEGALPDGTAPAQRQTAEEYGGLPEGVTELDTSGAIPVSKTDHKVANATYNVSGNLEQVANALAGKSEAGSVATALSSINYTTKNEKVVAAVIEVTSTVTLPVWSDRGKAPPEEQTEWDRFLAALKAHEQQHLTIDQTEFAGIHSKAIGKSEADADAALDAVETAATTKNAEFDTTTDHGRNAGTKLNPWVGKVIKVP